ncbi:MAG: TadE/TadG family type IV pilus assembly protein, partial [Gaiellaceae bacterium]
MTEFAFVLPILLVLLFGIIQFGIIFNNYVALTDAARA